MNTARVRRWDPTVQKEDMAIFWQRVWELGAYFSEGEEKEGDDVEDEGQGETEEDKNQREEEADEDLQQQEEEKNKACGKMEEKATCRMNRSFLSVRLAVTRLSSALPSPMLGSLIGAFDPDAPVI